MTTAGLWNKVDEHGELLSSLYDRWLDEREYEPVQEYLEVIQKYIPQAVAINRDFQIKLEAEDGILVVDLQLNKNQISITGVPDGRHFREPEQHTP